ncbi:MAG: cysteine desulfurase, partial [Clostridia bacterium]|nr:cysteine desulfurase [Clostridia bacterium]
FPMKSFYKNNFANPSSMHTAGQRAKNALDNARERCAAALGAKEQSEIIFTSGGTEANNLAIYGACNAYKEKGKHIITSCIEHHSVLNTFLNLEKQGFEISLIDVDNNGLINLEQLFNAVREDTIFISVMLANNEIGTIQPISKIGEICKEKGIIFHTDAVQALGNMPVNVKDLNVDLLSISGHKLYAPKGVGLLYVKSGTKIEPIFNGGSQERGKRPGTENIPCIIGLAKAMEIAQNELDNNITRLTALRNRLIDGVLHSIDIAYLNGSLENRLCNNANFSFKGIDGNDVVLNLDLKGICASGGAACASGAMEKSHVLKALGNNDGGVRFSLGAENTMEDVECAIDTVHKIIEAL